MNIKSMVNAGCIGIAMICSSCSKEAGGLERAAGKVADSAALAVKKAPIVKAGEETISKTGDSLYLSEETLKCFNENYTLPDTFEMAPASSFPDTATRNYVNKDIRKMKKARSFVNGEGNLIELYSEGSRRYATEFKKDTSGIGLIPLDNKTASYFPKEKLPTMVDLGNNSSNFVQILPNGRKLITLGEYHFDTTGSLVGKGYTKGLWVRRSK